MFIREKEQNTCDVLTVKNVSHLQNKWILKTSSISGFSKRQRKPIRRCSLSLEIASEADHFQGWGGSGADEVWRSERPRQIQFSVRTVTSSTFPHKICFRQRRIDLAYVITILSSSHCQKVTILAPQFFFLCFEQNICQKKNLLVRLKNWLNVRNFAAPMNIHTMIID